MTTTTKGMTPQAAAAAIGVPLCLSGLAAAFRGPQRAHWRRLAVTHGSLGIAAVIADRSLRRCRPTRRDAVIAVQVGLGLFAASSLADASARRSVPRLDDDARALSTLSSVVSPVRMSACLALVIAPGEELFWRGLLQGQFARRYGPRNAALLTSIVYGAAHVVTGNSAVTGAAMGMGSALSVMRANGASIERLTLTHACWVVPTLLRARARAMRSRDADTVAVRDHTKEGAAEMRASEGTRPAGRRVSRWSRLAQLANNSAHITLYKRTHGRLGNRMLGHEVGILTTAQRCGSQPYSVPLFTFRDGDDVIVVASYRGSAEHPAWFRNLLANPHATIQVGKRIWPVQAKVMAADERDVWWERVVRGFNGYADYQRRTSREIPVVRLTPRPAAK